MKSAWLGVIAAVAASVALMKLLSGLPDNAGAFEFLNPIAAVEGLAFALGFGAGLPKPLALVVAAGAVILIPVATFFLVRRMARRLDAPSRRV